MNGCKATANRMADSLLLASAGSWREAESDYGDDADGKDSCRL